MRGRRVVLFYRDFREGDGPYESWVIAWAVYRCELDSGVPHVGCRWTWFLDRLHLVVLCVAYGVNVCVWPNDVLGGFYAYAET